METSEAFSVIEKYIRAPRLTKREYFALHLMQARLTALGHVPAVQVLSREIAQNSLEWADALLAELNREKGGPA